jgi:hypothetical protein
MKYISANTVRYRNRSAGRFYFSRDTMKGFNSKLHDSAIETEAGLVVFVLSNKYEGQSREYLVKIMYADGTVKVGHGFSFSTLKAAEAYRKKLAETLDYLAPAGIIQVCYDTGLVYVWHGGLFLKVYTDNASLTDSIKIPDTLLGDVDLEKLDMWIYKQRYNRLEALKHANR